MTEQSHRLARLRHAVAQRALIRDGHRVLQDNREFLSVLGCLSPEVAYSADETLCPEEALPKWFTLCLTPWANALPPEHLEPWASDLYEALAGEPISWDDRKGQAVAVMMGHLDPAGDARLADLSDRIQRACLRQGPLKPLSLEANRLEQDIWQSILSNEEGGDSAEGHRLHHRALAIARLIGSEPDGMRAAFQAIYPRAAVALEIVRQWKNCRHSQ